MGQWHLIRVRQSKDKSSVREALVSQAWHMMRKISPKGSSDFRSKSVDWCLTTQRWTFRFHKSRKFSHGNKIRGFNVHGSVHRRNILIYIQQDATLHSLFYLETALHVSGGTTTHHQERKQLYLQHLVFVRPLLLPAATAAGSSNGSSTTQNM